jgi:hypothetical protein
MGAILSAGLLALATGVALLLISIAVERFARGAWKSISSLAEWPVLPLFMFATLCITAWATIRAFTFAAAYLSG